MAASAIGLNGLPAGLFHHIVLKVVLTKEIFAEFNISLLDDDNVLKVLHHLLLDTHLMEGELVCPESGHRFPVSNGIPNMM